MSLWLLNAFSLNMLSEFPMSIHLEEVTLEEAQELLSAGFRSAVGHGNTAALMSELLGLEVEAHRMTLSLQHGEKALIGQYSGPRLEEGVTSLPEGATLRWILLSPTKPGHHKS
jgi:hypothetical protein